jgi:hypothetical protein
MKRHPILEREERKLAELKQQIVELGLEQNVIDLELYGYTVLLNPEPIELFDEMREKVMELAEEDRRKGQVYSPVPENGYWVWRLLSRGEVFERALLSPKPLTLITYLLGRSCVVSSYTANVVKQGADYQGIHTDTNFVPNPLPPYGHTANVCWCLDDFTAEGGATRVVPSSHKMASHPPFFEAQDWLLPVEAPRGSIIIMNGNLWHCAGPKSTPGERVGILNYFSRMYMRTQEPMVDMISREIIERNPPRFAELIGAPYPDPNRYGPDPDHISKYFVRTRNPYG